MKADFRRNDSTCAGGSKRARARVREKRKEKVRARERNEEKKSDEKSHFNHHNALFGARFNLFVDCCAAFSVLKKLRMC